MSARWNEASRSSPNLWLLELGTIVGGMMPWCRKLPILWPCDLWQQQYGDCQTMTSRDYQVGVLFLYFLMCSALKRFSTWIVTTWQDWIHQRLWEFQYEELEPFLDGGPVDESLILYINPSPTAIFHAACQAMDVRTQEKRQIVALLTPRHGTAIILTYLDFCRELVHLIGWSSHQPTWPERLESRN